MRFLSKTWLLFTFCFWPLTIQEGIPAELEVMAQVSELEEKFYEVLQVCSIPPRTRCSNILILWIPIDLLLNSPSCFVTHRMPLEWCVKRLVTLVCLCARLSGCQRNCPSDGAPVIWPCERSTGDRRIHGENSRFVPQTESISKRNKSKKNCCFNKKKNDQKKTTQSCHNILKICVVSLSLLNIM